MKTDKILSALRIVSWIGFVGSIAIIALAICSFVLSFTDSAANISFKGVINYPQSLAKTNFFAYAIFTALTIAWAFVCFKLWQNLKDVLYKTDLNSPFKINIANQLVKVAYFLFALWLIAFIANGYADFISKNATEVERGSDANFSFLMVSGIVYIISQIFKHGVEIQNENDLTI